MKIFSSSTDTDSKGQVPLQTLWHAVLKKHVSAKTFGQGFQRLVEWYRKHKEILGGSRKGLFSGLCGSSRGREVNKHASNFQMCDVHLINWSKFLGIRPGYVYRTYILNGKCGQGPGKLLLLGNLVPVNNSETSIKRAFLNIPVVFRKRSILWKCYKITFCSCTVILSNTPQCISLAVVRTPWNNESSDQRYVDKSHNCCINTKLY